MRYSLYYPLKVLADAICYHNIQDLKKWIRAQQYSWSGSSVVKLTLITTTSDETLKYLRKLGPTFIKLLFSLKYSSINFKISPAANLLSSA